LKVKRYRRACSAEVHLKKEKLYNGDEITEGIDPLQSVFGLWKDCDINKEALRERT
jgi:hypothetical protein